MSSAAKLSKLITFENFLNLIKLNIVINTNSHYLKKHNLLLRQQTIITKRQGLTEYPFFT